MNNCGHCIHYRKRPYSENICLLSGKIVPYLSVRDCFTLKEEEKMEDEIKTKVCPECGRELPVTEFGKHVRTKDGLQPLCRECSSKKAKARHRNEETPEDNPIKAIKDQVLVNELRSRGWDVVCTRTVAL